MNSPAQTFAMTESFAGRIGAHGLERILSSLRTGLGMDVAFVARFKADARRLDYVDPESGGPLRAGQEIPLNDGYCQKVVRGELPALIRDTAALAAARDLPETRSIPIGAHLSVPIVFSDGSVYGTLCCFSHKPNAALSERDLRMMRVFADVLSLHLEAGMREELARQAAAREIRAAMRSGAPRILVQPVHAVRDGSLHGFECLSRFDIAPFRTPDIWFKAAHDAGIGLELELHVVKAAIALQAVLPAQSALAINSSPALILSGRLLDLADAGHDLSRVVLEITEHVAIEDYGALAAALKPFRDAGARLAVDDAGAGFSSMRHILNLKPDMIKLDMSITRGVDADVSRRALAKGLISFAHEIGSLVTAEGVETAAELATIGDLGVDFAQGYFLSRPLAVPDALRYCDAQFRR